MRRWQIVVAKLR